MAREARRKFLPPLECFLPPLEGGQKALQGGQSFLWHFAMTIIPPLDPNKKTHSLPSSYIFSYFNDAVISLARLVKVFNKAAWHTAVQNPHLKPS